MSHSLVRLSSRSLLALSLSLALSLIWKCTTNGRNLVPSSAFLAVQSKCFFCVWHADCLMRLLVDTRCPSFLNPNSLVNNNRLFLTAKRRFFGGNKKTCPRKWPFLGVKRPFLCGPASSTFSVIACDRVSGAIWLSALPNVLGGRNQKHHFLFLKRPSFLSKRPLLKKRFAGPFSVGVTFSHRNVHKKWPFLVANRPFFCGTKKKCFCVEGDRGGMDG